MPKTLGWIVGWMLALSLMLGAQAAVAAEVNPVDQLTGAVWMGSSMEQKEALLYGVECAITIEYFVAAQMAEQAQKATRKDKKKIINTLSPFEKGWATAFEGVSRQKIASDVDAWYKAHPDQWERPVFSVLWHEFIVPKTQ